MARPSQATIDSFMAITGASESLALRKLEEHGGNLDEAVDAHFGAVDRHTTNPTPAAAQQYGSMGMNDQNQAGSRGLVPFLSAARSFKPSLLLDPNYRRHLYNRIGASAFGSRGPFTSQSGEAGELPQRFNPVNEQPHHSGLRQTEDLSGLSHGQGTYGNHTEEEMIQAAIEASKKEVERGYLNQQHSSPNESSGSGLLQRKMYLEDDDFSRAISLSLKTAEQEKAMREQQVKTEDQEVGYYDLTGRSEKAKVNGWKLKPGSSSCQEGAGNVKEQPLVSRGSNSDTGNIGNCPPHSKDAIRSEEWGEISSEELDEAFMLENALFGEGSTNRFHYSPHQQINQDKSSTPHSVPNLPSPSVTAQRLLREQQDDEYLASLLADKEKEIKALKEAESHYLKEDKACNKLLEEERILAAKEASLPQEPAADDENAVTLLIRMPDGSRHGHRFLKSDKLQLLFDFIDVGRLVKSGTYRVVRPYPRLAFSIADSSLTFREIGLTSKQEALFLELI
ncbi:plant UBX domain-containing protein 8-like isoform X2 [Alnus glutinosa]|uniref:plant UBX domain-containing protein 8-like isoform X2 n=1 Tax=Alnus glutinosa TaxID=3517 RepID=UPI002D786A06|nr:plant UBX domain-containing protein 8-like isoform X2 [Alnus glutinosa]